MSLISFSCRLLWLRLSVGNLGKSFREQNRLSRIKNVTVNFKNSMDRLNSKLEIETVADLESRSEEIIHNSAEREQEKRGRNYK